MRATGIVRRIDDLGRVVIPREIRRNLGIREGDPLEIFTDKDQLVLVKYHPEYHDDLTAMIDGLQDEYHNTDDQDEKVRLSDLLTKARSLEAALKKAGY